MDRKPFWMFILFSVALILRLLWAFADHPQPFSDMEDYYLSAVNFLKGSYLAQSEDRLAYRAPMYPLFLALILKCSPFNTLLTIRIIQSILGSISTVLVYLISLQLLEFDKNKKIISHLFSVTAGFLFAFFSSQVFFTSVLMTESLFVFLILLWVYWSGRLDSKTPVWEFTLFSALLGIIALTRPIALFFLPVLVVKICYLLHRSKRIRYSIAPITAWALPIIPWTIRNILVLGAFVLISTNSGVNLFIGNNHGFGYYEQGYKEPIRQQYREQYGPNEVGEDRVFMKLGFQYALNNPVATLWRMKWKMYFLYILEKEPWPWEEYNQGKGIRYPYNLPIPLLHWNFYFLVFALIGILVSIYRKYPHYFVLSILAMYTIACAIFFARTRFRIPIEPFLLIYSCVGFLSLVEIAIWGYRTLLKKPHESKESPNA
jgi:hypothetical protein